MIIGGVMNIRFVGTHSKLGINVDMILEYS